jgi:hypothetical protein
MAQTARALSIERGVPAWAHFFSDLREVGAIRFLVDGQLCARVVAFAAGLLSWAIARNWAKRLGELKSQAIGIPKAFQQ